MINSQITITEQRPRQESNEIVTSFIDFLENTVDKYNLLKIKNNKKFDNLFVKINDYGDYIFQELVNIVTYILNIRIKDVLKNFLIFRHNISNTKL